MSRYLNRPLSRPVARVVAHTPLTPNAVTAFTLALAVASGAATAAGWNIAGGIAIQAVSVIGGVDGELARLRNLATRLGAVFDAVTDRYADAAMIAGMTIYASRFEEWPRAEVVGTLALAATLIVSYSRARIEADLGGSLRGGDALFGPASRDVSLLIAAVGTVAGQCYWTLVVLAAIGALTVAWGLAYLRFSAAAAEHRATSGRPPAG